MGRVLARGGNDRRLEPGEGFPQPRLAAHRAVAPLRHFFFFFAFFATPAGSFDMSSQ
jgi:hypothetical protein